ncbi:MAG: outer membrane protein assembly factor BamB [Legionellales bacterium]|jgi:outer membrane protein assembly factor BamB
MMQRSIVILSLSIFMLSACNKSKTVQNPPEELTTYPEVIAWQDRDSMDVGSGDGDMYLRLEPAFERYDDQVLSFTTDYKGRISAIAWDDDAQRLWRERPDDIDVTGGIGAGSGIVLVGTQKGEVVALSQSEGEELWRTRLSSDILSAPQSAENTVVVLTEDSRVYGLKAQNGEIIWSYKHTAPLLQLRGSAPVIIDDGKVYVGFANGFVSALDLKTGQLLWQQAVSYPRGRSEIDRVVDVNGRMAIKNDILYAVNYQGRVVAIDTRSQRLLWEKEFSSYAGLTVNDEAVFITDDESVIWALDRDTGDTLWKQPDLLFREVTAPAVFHNMIVVGDYEGYVHMIQADNGQLLGRTQVGGAPIHTPVVTIGNEIFILSSSGDLTRLTPVRKL